MNKGDAMSFKFTHAITTSSLKEFNSVIIPKKGYNEKTHHGNNW